MKWKADSLKGSVNTIHKPLAKLRRKEKTQVIKIRNKTEDVAIDPADIKKMIRTYYEQLYTHKFDNLNETGQFLEKYKLPQFTQYEQRNSTTYYLYHNHIISIISTYYLYHIHIISTIDNMNSHVTIKGN